MDVVFDTVGGDTLQRSWGLLRPTGRMITIAAEGESATDARVKAAFFIVVPNHDQLTRIGNLLESGDLEPVVDSVLPLSQASAAYTEEAGRKRRRGKVVVAVRPDAGHCACLLRRREHAEDYRAAGAGEVPPRPRALQQRTPDA